MKANSLFKILTLLTLAFILSTPMFSLAHATQITGGTITSLSKPTDREEINKFKPTDSVYAKGSALKPLRRYIIYIINDTTLIEGMMIPPSVANPVTATADATGYLAPTLVWASPLKPGNYDIIADCQDEGVRGYLDDSDAIDDMEINYTAGFFVIPEVPLGAIMALSACALAFLIKRKI